MNQGQPLLATGPGAAAPAGETNHASSTTAVMANIKRRAAASARAYPELPRPWPELAPAVAVHIYKVGQGLFRIPVKLMRKCGMRPELGVHIATLSDRTLIWGGDSAGPYKQEAESKQFALYRAGVSARVTKAANFAIIEGPDYLVVTTRNKAMAMTGDVPVYEHAPWEKLSTAAVQPLKDSLPTEGLEVRGWMNTSIYHTNSWSKAGTARVCGSIWFMAGLVGGDPIRFIRYKNATVVEKCDPSEKHSVVCQSKRGHPSHYFGKSLIPVEQADVVRVLATPGRLILALADSDIGRLCDNVLSRGYCSKQAAKAVLSDVLAPPGALAADGLNVLALKDYDKPGPSINIYGRIWDGAGMPRLQPARLIRHTNAVVVEKCSEAEAEFRIGSPSQDVPYRCVSLLGTALANTSKIRVLVLPGRLVLTGRNSDLGLKFRTAEQWPSDSDDVRAMLARITAQTAGAAPPAVDQVPLEDVGGYSLPVGKRLQIQGRWLSQFGFTPGARFEVKECAGELQLHLVAEGGSAVTEHSPGAGKLYVPAASIEALNAQQVRVMGRQGELRLVPLAQAT